MMHVLHVNTLADGGGAAIAASRLSAALQAQGVTSSLCVRRGHLPFLMERLRIFVANGCSRNGLWLVDIANVGEDITRREEFRRADIVHLHWVNQGFLSLNSIGRILDSGKPVVWTLHDMWPVTAICHHAGRCSAYTRRCHDCPMLCNPAPDDLSAQVFDRKRQVYTRGHINFVGVSRWTADKARKSALTQGHDVHVIHNALPVAELQPMPQAQARRELSLPEDAKVIVFGAARLDLPLKGLNRLFDAIRRTGLPRQKIHLLLFGGMKDDTLLSRVPCGYTYVGPVAGAQALSRLYSAADFVASASSYETFGQTLAEAMACGCVPVSFDSGGQSDIIHHLHDGYLAHAGNVDDLARGLKWAFGQQLDAAALRQSVLDRFGADVVARQYIQLYQSCLDSR